MLQNGDFWVFERGNATKSKTTTLPSNIEFPLWKGKTWSYASEALKSGQPQTSKAPRIPVRIECTAVNFRPVTVMAGTFEAYECECQCNVTGGRYDTDCGRWTMWYAPAVKNIIRTKTGSTDTSLELIQYRASTQSSREANRAVVLVIDKSGSMADQKRMHYAKEAAKAIARQLHDADLFGVIGFDVTAFTLIPLEQVGHLRERDSVEKQIDRLKPGGQTYFLPALAEAKSQLEGERASKKYIVLLSDGVTRGSQADLANLVLSMKKELAITVSTIAISNEADIKSMKQMALYGGGSFQLVCNPSILPEIVLETVLSDAAPPQQNKQDQKCP